MADSEARLGSGPFYGLHYYHPGMPETLAWIREVKIEGRTITVRDEHCDPRDGVRVYTGTIADEPDRNGTYRIDWDDSNERQFGTSKLDTDAAEGYIAFDDYGDPIYPEGSAESAEAQSTFDASCS